MKKRWQEPEVIAKMAKRERGVVSDETRRKLSKASSGKGNGMYGKPAWNRGMETPQWQKDRISKANKEHARKRKEKFLKEISGRTEKECRHCKEIKPLEMFWKSASNIDGYIGNCKICDTARRRNNRRKKKLKELIND